MFMANKDLIINEHRFLSFAVFNNSTAKNAFSTQYPCLLDR